MTIHDSFTSLSSSFLSSFSSIYGLRDSLEVAKRKKKKVCPSSNKHDDDIIGDTLVDDEGTAEEKSSLQDEKDKKLKQRRRGVRRGPQPAISSSFTFEDIHSNSAIVDIPTKTYDGPSSAVEATTTADDGAAPKKSRRQ